MARNRIGRALDRAGRIIVDAGHRVGRWHWATGAALTRVGLRVHLAGWRHRDPDGPR